MATIGYALAQVKSDLPRHVDEALIRRACEQAGHQWRERVLGPTTTVWGFLRQVMAGNIACVALRHILGVTVAASAYPRLAPHPVPKKQAQLWQRRGICTSSCWSAFQE